MKTNIIITEKQFDRIVIYLNTKNNLLSEATLRRGSRGKEVEKIQAKLGLGVDGKFGNDTYKAVVKFQKRKGLKPDGVVGPITMGALFSEKVIKPNVIQSAEFPFKELANNPKASFVADVIKKSKGSSWYKNDKEDWAEAAFNTIKSKSMYNDVSKKLGQDTYTFIDSFMNTKKEYHVNSIYDHYIELFPEYKPANCSPEIINPSGWSDLYKILVGRGQIKKGEPLLVIWGPSQNLYYTTDGKTLALSSKVSTGKDGFGNIPDQPKTSTGLLKIAGKITAEDYEVLVGKTPTGTILGPNKDGERVDAEGVKHIAEVLTGILELDGLEPCNKNIYSRNIYIHGTNKEGLLGSKRSNGCIRVPNEMIKQLLSTLKVGTKVYVYPSK